MEVYTPALLILLIILAAALIHQQFQSSPPVSLSLDVEDGTLDTLEGQLNHESATDELLAFRTRFLQIYCFAIAADWLQGSFTYSLYKNTHHIKETVIAALFATGFLSAGIGAFFVGAYADRFGRKRACLSYCGLYAVSCLLILSPSPTHLFLGRIVGGLSTTILFTTFETWMIAEHNRISLGHCNGMLNSIFGTMAVLNGWVAIGCGLVSQFLVKMTSSEKSPFLASIFCLVLAGILISTSWVENYGTPKSNSSVTSGGRSPRIGSRILTMTYVTTFLEGSMYIMVFSWGGLLISARELAFKTESPPLGTIFASLMCSMTLGSHMFTLATRDGNDSLQVSSHAIQVALSFAASSLLLAIMAEREAFRFLSLCLFELALGIYFPAVAYTKSLLVPEEHRAKIYGAMRVPLNTFVVIMLSRVQDTDSSRERRLVMCSGFLLVGVILTARFMHPLDGRVKQESVIQR